MRVLKVSGRFQMPAQRDESRRALVQRDRVPPDLGWLRVLNATPTV